MLFGKGYFASFADQRHIATSSLKLQGKTLNGNYAIFRDISKTLSDFFHAGRGLVCVGTVKLPRNKEFCSRVIFILRCDHCTYLRTS